MKQINDQIIHPQAPTRAKLIPSNEAINRKLEKYLFRLNCTKKTKFNRFRFNP